MKYIYTLVLIQVLLVSCKKFLDTKPTDFLTPSEYYQTESQLEYALGGVYDILGNGNLYSNRMLYRLGLEGDEGFHAKTSPATGPQIYDFSPADADVNNFWNALYTGIGRANLLLKSVDNNENINEATRSRIRGEALFLRAYYYFLLVQNFGGVPLLLDPVISAKETDRPRASTKEVYERIVSDMTIAEGLVKGIKEWGFGGRVSKSAVRGILARVCLHMAGFPLNDVSKYEDARNWAKKVMDDVEAGHELNPSFSQVFINYAQDKYDTKESIWEVEFKGNGSDAFEEMGLVGYLNGIDCSNPLTGNSYGAVKITADFYQSFEPGDLRRDWSIANFTYSATGPSGTKNFRTTTSRSTLYGRPAGKYRREFETVLPKSPSYGPINFPLLRFSDVLLMFAEAENEINGPTPEAINAVNMVRKRAWSTGIKSISMSNGGTGYSTTNPPVITFSGGGGSQAIASATLSNGRVASVNFTLDDIIGFKNGIGYTSTPEVVITSSVGSGATATATIYTETDAIVKSEYTIDKAAFKKFLIAERARELCFETLRKHDLIRWGIFVETMNKMGATILKDVPTAWYVRGFNNVSEKHLLWPIPSKELALNMAMVQNPGW